MVSYRTQQLANSMWRPMQEELGQVILSGGAVTAALSAWSNVSNLAKQESGSKFFGGMERYVNQRRRVASLAASASRNDQHQRKLESEQQLLLFISRELIEIARNALRGVPVISAPDSIVAEAALKKSSLPPVPAARRTYQKPRTPASFEEPKLAGRRVAQRVDPVPAADLKARATPVPTASTNRPVEAPRPVEIPKPPRPAVVPPVEPVAPVVSAQPPPVVVPPVEPVTPSVPKPPQPVVIPPVEPIAPVVSMPTRPEVAPPVEPVAPVDPRPSRPLEVPTPTPVPTASHGGIQFDVASVCGELFGPKVMSYETNRLFDEKYKDQTVRWTGTARRANVFSYDFTFGEEGTKVEFDVHEIDQGYGSRTVKAFVKLPKDAIDDIRSRIGEEVAFEGRLMTCEGSARRIYVADARLVE
jgi:hypothetical protein